MDDLLKDKCFIQLIFLFLPRTTLSREMYSLMSFSRHVYLCQQLGVLRVMILLVENHVDSFFEEHATCHLLVGCVVSDAKVYCL